MNSYLDSVVTYLQRHLAPGPQRRTGRRRPLPMRQAPRSRPRLEALEDRCVPSAGQLDLTFGNAGRVLTDISNYSLDSPGSIAAYQSDGKFVVAGLTIGAPYGPESYDFAVVRYNSDGSLDTSFGVDGIVTVDFGGSFDVCTGVALDNSDRIVMAGVSDLGGTTGLRFAVVRLTSDGALDTSFDTDGKQTVDFSGTDGNDVCQSVAVDSIGNVIVAGTTHHATGHQIFAVARLTDDGALDLSFDTDGKQTVDFGNEADTARSVAVDSLDRVLVAGDTYLGSSEYDFAVARLMTDGALDPSFGTDGKQTIDFGTDDEAAYSMAVDSADRVLLAGYSQEDATGYDFAVARLTTDGALDPSFGIDGKQTVDFGGSDDWGFGVAVDSADRVLVGGVANQAATGEDFAVARLTSSGALDTSFDTDGKQTVDFGTDVDEAYSVAVDSQGRILLTGQSNQITTNADFAVARLLGDDFPPNLTPVANAGGPYTVVRGGTVLLDASGSSDPDLPDDTLTYTWDFDGDGGYDDATGPNPSFSAAGLTTGTRTIGLRVSDAAGATDDATAAVTVVAVALLPDPGAPGAQALFVGGTMGNDTIVISPAGNTGALEVKLNGASLGTFQPTGRIVVYAQAGDDDVQVAGSIPRAAWLYGGDGSDRLKGGDGNNVLVGGDGDDLLVGGRGRNVLIGGRGKDRIVGGSGDDILIAGWTSYDNSPADLNAVMQEWTRTDKTYAERVNNLKNGGGLNGTIVLTAATVFSDTDEDKLTGSAGQDWFFYDSQRDKVTDLSDPAFASDLPFIGP